MPAAGCLTGVTKWRLGQGEGQERDLYLRGGLGLCRNVPTNGPKSADTYRPKYPISFIYFIFGYSVDTYPRRIGCVSVSGAYPPRIREFPDVSVFCSNIAMTSFYSME